MELLTINGVEIPNPCGYNPQDMHAESNAERSNAGVFVSTYSGQIWELDISYEYLSDEDYAVLDKLLNLRNDGKYNNVIIEFRPPGRMDSTPLKGLFRYSGIKQGGLYKLRVDNYSKSVWKDVTVHFSETRPYSYKII